MKEKISQISEALSGKQKSISVRGWVKRKRHVSDSLFLLLRDSSGEMQCVAKKDSLPEEEWQNALKISRESSAKLSGTIVQDKRAPGGAELKIEKMEIVQLSENFPIQKDFSEEYLLDVRHLWLRSKKMQCITKIRDSVLFAVREYFRKEGFFETSPAIITPSACEGGTTLFDFDYFGEKRYLSQSAQMYLEVLIYSLEKVWALTPSFRAEKSKTARHLTEYWHLEGEAAWMDMNDMMQVIEEMVEFVCKKIASERKEELEFLGRNPQDLLKVKAPFRKISYDDAIAELAKKHNIKIKWGNDLSIKEEKALGKSETQPFFIHSYPTKIKAFYVKEHPEDSSKCYSFDLIAPEGFGELCTGGQREDIIENMVEKLKKDKIPLENYQWYLDLRRYGSVPHSGFGLGIERLLTWACKLPSIKDAIPFPRTLSRSYP